MDGYNEIIEETDDYTIYRDKLGVYCYEDKNSPFRLSSFNLEICTNYARKPHREFTYDNGIIEETDDYIITRDRNDIYHYQDKNSPSSVSSPNKDIVLNHARGTFFKRENEIEVIKDNEFYIITEDPNLIYHYEDKIRPFKKEFSDLEECIKFARRRMVQAVVEEDPVAEEILKTDYKKK